MENINENPDFTTRYSKFCKIVNMLYNLDAECNLELSYYELTSQVSPSIFDNTEAISFTNKASSTLSNQIDSKQT